MAIYKDEGTWTVQCRIRNKDGSVKQHKKRGFKTKREATEYQQKILSDEPKFQMTVKDFYPIYLNDKRGEVKERTLMTKKHMIETHVIPYFGEMQIDEIDEMMYGHNVKLNDSDRRILTGAISKTVDTVVRVLHIGEKIEDSIMEHMPDQNEIQNEVQNQVRRVIIRLVLV